MSRTARRAAPHGRWTTRVPGVPWHLAVLMPVGDTGGDRHRVIVTIPEALTAWQDAMSAARALEARVTLICDSRRQAEDAAKAAARDLPEHRRIAIDRAFAGAWGALS
jgi:hypothetical protein